jgi:hypothetical protein
MYITAGLTRACSPTAVTRLRLGQRGQLLGLGRRPSERPLAIDMLARFERRFCRFVVRRDADDDRNGIDLR